MRRAAIAGKRRSQLLTGSRPDNQHLLHNLLPGFFKGAAGLVRSGLAIRLAFCLLLLEVNIDDSGSLKQQAHHLADRDLLDFNPHSKGFWHWSFPPWLGPFARDHAAMIAACDENSLAVFHHLV